MMTKAVTKVPKRSQIDNHVKSRGFLLGHTYRLGVHVIRGMSQLNHSYQTRHIKTRQLLCTPEVLIKYEEGPISPSLVNESVGGE